MASKEEQVVDTGLQLYEQSELKSLLLTPTEIRGIPYYKNTWDGTLPYLILIKQVQKLLEDGYRLIPELKVLSDDAIQKAFDNALNEPSYFNHEPTVEEIFLIRLRAVANTQLEADKEVIGGVK